MRIFALVFIAVLAAAAAASASEPAGEDDNGEAKAKDLEEILKCCGDAPIKRNRRVVEIGYLTAVKGAMHNRFVQKYFIYYAIKSLIRLNRQATMHNRFVQSALYITR